MSLERISFFEKANSDLSKATTLLKVVHFLLTLVYLLLLIERKKAGGFLLSRRECLRFLKRLADELFEVVVAIDLAFGHFLFASAILRLQSSERPCFQRVRLRHLRSFRRRALSFARPVLIRSDEGRLVVVSEDHIFLSQLVQRMAGWLGSWQLL